MSWKPMDLTPYMDDSIEVPKPTVGTVRGSSLGLFYAGRVNQLFGPSGSGKTWLILGIVAEYLMLGHDCVFVDHEDHPLGALSRLTALGVSRAQILEHFIYVQPDVRWSKGAEDALRESLEGRQPTLVAIDSTGEGMALDGCNPNLDDDVARWFRGAARYFASTGAAVILLDHVSKSSVQASDMAVGSFRKKAAISGAAYRLRVKSEPSRESSGLLEAITSKCRYGWRKTGNIACEVRVTPGEGDRVTLSLYAPKGQDEGGKSAPIWLMERITSWLAEVGRPVTLREARDAPIGRNGGKAYRESVDDALRELRDREYISWPSKGRISILRTFSGECV